MQLSENASKDTNTKLNFYKVSKALGITPTIVQKWWKARDDIMARMKKAKAGSSKKHRGVTFKRKNRSGSAILKLWITT